MRLRQQSRKWAVPKYTDLALYGALHEYNAGNLNESRSIYRKAIEEFDGVGFADKAFDEEGSYATYKLALAIFLARLVDEGVDVKLLVTFFKKQWETGGFIALYDKGGLSLNDTNTETTSYALLALSSLKPDYNHTFFCKMPSQ
jgi:hypothetical protein